MKYTRCKWCQGKGCLACEAQAEKDYNEQFPDGPKPIASISFDDKEGMSMLSSILSPEGLADCATEGKARTEQMMEGNSFASTLTRALLQDHPEGRALIEHDHTVAVMTERMAAIGCRDSQQ